MKFLKLLVVPLSCVLLFGATGCKKSYYRYYTNIPQDKCETVGEDFQCGAVIGGLNAFDRQFEEEDTSSYTSRERLYSAMGADAQMVVSADFAADGAEDRYAEFTKSVYSLLDNIGKALSPTVSGSDVNRFNAAAAGETVEISQVTYEVLTTAFEIFILTDGCYNPALYYNVEAYGFEYTSFYPQSADDLPDDEVVAKYTALAKSFPQIKLSENDGVYTVTKPAATVDINGETFSMKLDLGGIGKGYAVDCVEELFDVYGYKYGYFNYGASSMLIKSNVREGDYRLELINPRSPRRDSYVRLSARNEKLSTSGDNERYYLIDGVRYCHIIDPSTGKPVQTGIMSATVIGGSAAQADALTTAIMCMGKEKAIQFIEEKLTDRKVIFTVE